MLSRRTASWKLHDWFFLIIVVVVVFAIFTAALHGIAPNSGLAQGIHKADVQVSALLHWIADFFVMLANWFASW